MLDEPTNDLDMETLDLLQEVIADYEGTVLIVSHDRDFLDRTVTITLGLDGSGKVDIVAGGYEDWVRKRTQPPAPAAGGAGGRQSEAGSPPLRPAPASGRGARKLTYKDQRDYELLPRADRGTGRGDRARRGGCSPTTTSTAATRACSRR